VRDVIGKTGTAMIRSQLVQRVHQAQPHLERAEAETIVSTILDAIVGALAAGRRVELRGFGAFTTRARRSRTGRNPRTGDPVEVPPKRVPFFRAGKEMRARLNLQAEEA